MIRYVLVFAIFSCLMEEKMSRMELFGSTMQRSKSDALVSTEM